MGLARTSQERTAACIREVSNWAAAAPEFKVDAAEFDKFAFREAMPVASPKLQALVDRIKLLDSQDQQRDGKTYKHILYTDVKSGQYGLKLLGAALVSACGCELAYDGSYVLDEERLRRNPGRNVALLCSSTLWGKPTRVRFRKALLEVFNRRPENTHGDLLRFLVLDQGFKEGIDVFDVKYVHLLEPLVTRSDERQVVGRGTRFCGQSGLRFDPEHGWPLYVFRYEMTLPEDGSGSNGPNGPNRPKRMMELYQEYSGLDTRKLVFASELEKAVMEAAVDSELTRHIHSFGSRAPPPAIPRRKKSDAEDTTQVEEETGEEATPGEERTAGIRNLFGLVGGADKKQKQQKRRNPEKERKMRNAHVKRKRKLNKRLPPNPPRSKKKLAAMRAYIEERFSQFAWPKASMENKCPAPPIVEDDGNGNGKEGQEGGAASIVEFNPTQEFVRHYFQPASAYKGLLLFHGVGTGKTCCAIATATTGWEPRGYTILWVTRHTLRPDIWKNMYQQVCSLVVQKEMKKGQAPPQDAVKHPRRLLSRQWMMPLSYKQFSNALAGKNEYHHELVRRNGAKDPLRKTLIILDEAHKLYAQDMVGTERPDVPTILGKIQASYDTSKEDSCRVLLMTATPYNANPMDMIRLLNMLRTKEDALPDTWEEFAPAYLDGDGVFTKAGRARFQDDISGYVSYLNREKDGRSFATPVYDNVVVPMSQSTVLQEQATMEGLVQQVATTKANLEEGKAAVKAAKARAKVDKAAAIAAQCAPLPVKQRPPCKAAITQQMEAFEQQLLGELETKIARDEDAMRTMKEQIRESKRRLKDKSFDRSVERALVDRCKVALPSYQKE